MIDWVLNFRFNTPLALTLYWLPVAVCSVGYTIRCFKQYRKEIDMRAAHELSPHNSYYLPRLTIGTLVGRLIVTFVPVANLVATICDVGYEMLRGTLDWIGEALDIPLVPKRGKEE